MVTCNYEGVGGLSAVITLTGVTGPRIFPQLGSNPPPPTHFTSARATARGAASEP